MICEKCGNYIPEDSLFCDNCGAAVESHSPTVAPAAPTGNPGKGLGIASMILGICSVAICLIPCINYIGAFVSPILSILAIIFGFIAKNKSKSVGLSNPFAVAGLATGFAAIGLYALVIVLYILYIVVVFIISFLGAAVSTPSYYYY